MSFIHSGFLNKRGVSLRSWQRKFFVISSSSHVECWDSAEAFQKPGAMPKGRIVCKGLTVIDTPAETQKPFQFELQDGSKRPWVLAAESAEDQEEWIDVIRSCVGECEEETDQQVTPEPEAGITSVPQAQVEDLNVSDLIKKIKATKVVPAKLEVLVSELSPIPNSTITAQELVGISSCFTNADHRVSAIELLARHVESLTVSDLASLISKTPKVDGKMKIIESCCHKLLYDLPWDTEPIYKSLSPIENKSLARELITSARGANHIQNSVESSIPTPEMLIKGLTGSVPDEEKFNIIHSWLASVSNPVVSPEELTKIIKKFKNDKQRIEVLDQISKLMEMVSVQDMVALLKVFQTPADKLTALPIVAHKLEYQSESDLEPLFKLFTVAEDKESVRAMFESTTVNLEEASVEQNIKQDATSAMVQPPVSQQATTQHPVQQPATPQAIPQCEVNVFNFAQFKKKLRAAKEVEGKMEVLESELSSAFDITLTVKEIQTIAATFPNDSNRVTAIVLLSEYIPSFDVTEFASLIAKIPDNDGKLKVIEACCHKLVYALPWDTEPIYKVVEPEKKNFGKGTHCFCSKHSNC
ncbi:hypothetical protein GEMRC1_005602 [Eukaryota sp. GEM-RC1]